MRSIESGREFMKSGFATMDGRRSDQSQGRPKPPLQKPHDTSARIVALPKVTRGVINKPDIYANLRERRSRRQFSDQRLSLEELSFLLWATQGVDEVLGDGHATLRPVPSAGARHAFETYIAAARVKGLAGGVYRYLPLTHELVFLFDRPDMAARLTAATLGQKFVGDAAAVFVWSCVAYRGEWRYQHEAHKAMLLDAGHVGQNLYLAVEAIGCGTCAIAAYDQAAIDELVGLEGRDEFTVYLAPVGKLP